MLKEEFTEGGTITRVFSSRYAVEKIVYLYSKKKSYQELWIKVKKAVIIEAIKFQVLSFRFCPMHLI
jgi:hypothetical protein